MQILENSPQGSAAWHTARATRFCASEASAAMGVSKYTTRSELLRQKATGIAPEVSPSTQRLFNAGHSAEAEALKIAEEIAGVEFFPAVGIAEVEGLPLLASFDGIDMLEEVVWENKLRNAALVGQVADRELEPHYWAQLEHQLLVSGASRALFTTSDGTPEGTDSLWYESDPARRLQIISAWKQFERDLAEYVDSPVIVEMPKPRATTDLPALFIRAKGEITADNMQDYGLKLAEKLHAIRSIALVTDQDFSDAKLAAKQLRENIESAKQAKAAMLAETVTVGEAARMIDAWCEDMRLTALQLEKDVEREDKAKKAAMVAATRDKYTFHIASLESEIQPIRLNVAAPAFADALKNKRNFASMQDALDTMLAGAKIAADAAARAICVNLDCIKTDGAGYEFLFADKAQIVAKATDDLKLLVSSRIDTHKKAEAAREEATRQRIRAEEQAKAERDAREKLAREQREAAAAQKLIDDAALAEKKAKDIAPVMPHTAPTLEKIMAEVAPPAVAQIFSSRHSAAPMLSLGQIEERLGFAVTAGFLKMLGIESGSRGLAVVLYHESKYALILAALANHIKNLQVKQAD